MDKGNTILVHLVKPVLSGSSKRTPKIGFRYQLSLKAGQKYCRMLQFKMRAFCNTFRPSLSYHFPLGPSFWLFKWPHMTVIVSNLDVIMFITGFYAIHCSVGKSNHSQLCVLSSVSPTLKDDKGNWNLRTIVSVKL